MIWLENAVFTSLITTGVLAAGAFRIGTAALDTDDRIIYNNGNGQLMYDINGSGAGGAIVSPSSTRVWRSQRRSSWWCKRRN